MEESIMNNEEQGREARGREREFRGVEARPRNWLVPVILLSLREWNSYGVRAHGAGFGLRVRGDEPWNAVQDAPADGERGYRRVQLGDLEGWACAQDVHHHGRWQIIPRLLGQVA